MSCIFYVWIYITKKLVQLSSFCRFFFLLFAKWIYGCLAFADFSSYYLPTIYLVFWFVCCWEFVPDLRIWVVNLGCVVRYCYLVVGSSLLYCSCDWFSSLLLNKIHLIINKNKCSSSIHVTNCFFLIIWLSLILDSL